MNQPRVLGVIPARGGSKRLPRKNILKVGGHPLIAHTIMAAAAATRLTDWLVTSDDDEIIDISKRYGASVPFKRPPELGGDTVRNIDTMIHALNYMEQATGLKYDMIMLLQPTSPIRDPAHIDQAVELLWRSGLPTLASVKGPYKKRDPNLKRIGSGGVLEDYCGGRVGTDWDPFYIYNAAIYAIRRDYLLDERSFVSPRQVPLVMDDLHSVDVDEELDLIFVEACFDYLRRKGLRNYDD